MMPSLSVVHTRAVAAQERRAGALLAAEAERAVEQAVDEPLESDRHFDERDGRAARRRDRSCCCSPPSCRPPRRARHAGRCVNRYAIATAR